MLARLRGGTPGKVFTPGEEAVNRIRIHVKYSGRLPNAMQVERIVLSGCLQKSGGSCGAIFGRPVAKSIARAVNRVMIIALIDVVRFAKNLCLIHKDINELSVD